MRRVALLFAIACIAGATGAPAQLNQTGLQRVIVTLRDDVPLDAYAAAFVPDARTQNPRAAYHSRSVVGAIMSLERAHGFTARAFYSRAIRGFAASLTAAQRDGLARDPLVASIEADIAISLPPMTTLPQIVDWGIPKIGADRSSTHSGDGSGVVSGVNVYVIDTGVDPTHPDINLVNHVTFTGDPNADCVGHGTGVAGIIAGRDNDDFTVGVAPGAAVTGVKVFGCDGLTFPSYIIQGVDWVTANAKKPAVANMSLGSLIPLTALNTAVKNSAASGIFYAVAAGNGNPFTGQAVNACLSSPAGAAYDPPNTLNGIVAVAATDMSDMEASFSNFGVCVNLWAPGVDVTAPWLMSQGGTITASGTSFASPYVAGAAALLLSRAPGLTPPQVEFVLRYVADVPGTVSKDGTPIRRLNTSYW